MGQTLTTGAPASTAAASFVRGELVLSTELFELYRGHLAPTARADAADYDEVSMFVYTAKDNVFSPLASNASAVRMTLPLNIIIRPSRLSLSNAHWLLGFLINDQLFYYYYLAVFTTVECLRQSNAVVAFARRGIFSLS